MAVFVSMQTVQDLSREQIWSMAVIRLLTARFFYDCPTLAAAPPAVLAGGHLA